MVDAGVVPVRRSITSCHMSLAFQLIACIYQVGMDDAETRPYLMGKVAAMVKVSILVYALRLWLSLLTLLYVL
jgi:hypothetical protein